MAINSINNYVSAASTVATDSKVSSKKTESSKNDTSTGVIYEKGSSDKSSSSQKTQNSALIAKMKADSDSRISQLRGIVEQMMSKQGAAIGKADDMWSFLAGGNFTVSADVKAQAQADIAEEVARFYGYDKIPMTLPSGEATTGKLPYKLRIEEKAREIAVFSGFSQGMCYSFESPKVFDKLLLPEDDELRKAIKIANPLGEDFSIMRTTSLNGMLTSLATNYNRRNKDVKLFEMANVYIAKELPLTELPDERMQMTLGMYGDGDFFTMKGVVEEFFDAVGMTRKKEYDPKAGKPFLHPGRQANIVYDGVVLGYLGEVHPLVLENYNIGTRAYVAVLDMPAIVPFTTFDRKYEGIAKFPAVVRDLSMVVPHDVLVGQIESVLAQRGGKILEHYELFDIYEGEQVKKGYKSVAYSLSFRAKDRTLEEADINAALKKILNGLEQRGIELRQ